MEAPLTESKGSVKITRNAKGEPQFEVKVYTGETTADIACARQIALEQYEQLEASLTTRVVGE
jgi:hypothetical protein